MGCCCCGIRLFSLFQLECLLQIVRNFPLLLFGKLLQQILSSDVFRLDRLNKLDELPQRFRRLTVNRSLFVSSHHALSHRFTPSSGSRPVHSSRRTIHHSSNRVLHCIAAAGGAVLVRGSTETKALFSTSSHVGVAVSSVISDARSGSLVAHCAVLIILCLIVVLELWVVGCWLNGSLLKSTTGN